MGVLMAAQTANKLEEALVAEAALPIPIKVKSCKEQVYL